jgi:hypothetical protein
LLKIAFVAVMILFLLTTGLVSSRGNQAYALHENISVEIDQDIDEPYGKEMTLSSVARLMKLRMMKIM